MKVFRLKALDLPSLLMRDRRQQVAVRAVAATVGHGLPDIEALWRKASLTVQNGRQAGQTLSLEDLIDRHRRVIMVDGGEGPQPVETIFTSLVLVAGEPMPDPEAIQRFLRDRISHSFEPLIDPLDPVTISLHTSLDAAPGLTVWLGYGIHAPQPGVMTRGSVDFVPDGESIGTPMTLPDTAPAALFPGQRWLAFGRSEAIAPATHPDLPAGVLFLLAQAGELGPLRGPAESAPALLALQQADDTVAVEIAPAGTGGQTDESYELSGVSAQQGRVRLGRIEVRYDVRASRLRALPPGDPIYLRVIGVAVPARLEAQRIARFWLELASGGLRTSSLQSAGEACVVQAGQARLYSRQDMRYLPRDPGFDVSLAEGDAGKLTLLCRRDGHLGFVALPHTPAAVTFHPATSAGSADAWPLDWLDEALVLDFGGRGIETIGTRWPRRPAARLCRHGATLQLEDSSDAWLLEGGKLQRARGSISPNRRLVLGPLVVDVVEADG
jgi:hypothetical protein